MATNTTKLGLRKPGENDFYNQQTEQADNWDKVDKFADDIQNLVDNNSGKKITGYIQDSGEKVLGNYYLDKLATGLFKCIKSGDINYNSSEYFENDSNYALSDKLQNLITVKNEVNTPVKFNSSGTIYYKSTFDTFKDTDLIYIVCDGNNAGEGNSIIVPVSLFRNGPASTRIVTKLFDKSDSVVSIGITEGNLTVTAGNFDFYLRYACVISSLIR